MAIALQTKYSGVVDEKFKEGAKSASVVNSDFSFVGARAVTVQTISTATLNDYDRDGASLRYGSVETLNVTSQTLTMSQDKSFAFSIDTMDMDETALALTAGTALERQIREVMIPTVDTYRFGKIIAGAGNTATATLTASDIYDAILKATETLDDAEVPQDGRILIVPPAIYALLKSSTEIILDTDMSDNQRKQGVISMIDGMGIIKVPATRLTAKTNFVVTHPSACTSPVKLASYKIHNDAVGYSGAVIEGRFYYDAFVLTNKEDAIYLHKTA
jgi:hypothetical protein